MGLADFKILGEVGGGAFATVIKVERISDNQIYALKRCNIINMDQKELQNTLNEVRILASVRHPYIVGYYESFLANNNTELCLILEFCGQGDIATVLDKYRRRRQFLSESQVWKYFGQILEALKVLHENNICHRDVKAANCFLGQDGSLKLGDMNISKRMKGGVLLQTQTGTPYFMSPEIWAHQAYSTKADMWALGCLTYEIASLRKPFTADSFPELCETVTAGNYAPLPKHFSEKLKNVIGRLIVVDPEKRASAKELMASENLKEMLEQAQVIITEPDDAVSLLDTIKAPFPAMIHRIEDKLPRACYPDIRPHSPESWPARHRSQSPTRAAAGAVSRQTREGRANTENGDIGHSRAISELPLSSAHSARKAQDSSHSQDQAGGRGRERERRARHDRSASHHSTSRSGTGAGSGGGGGPSPREPSPPASTARERSHDSRAGDRGRRAGGDRDRDRDRGDPRPPRRHPSQERRPSADRTQPMMGHLREGGPPLPQQPFSPHTPKVREGGGQRGRYRGREKDIFQRIRESSQHSHLMDILEDGDGENYKMDPRQGGKLGGENDRISFQDLGIHDLGGRRGEGAVDLRASSAKSDHAGPGPRRERKRSALKGERRVYQGGGQGPPRNWSAHSEGGKPPARQASARSEHGEFSPRGGAGGGQRHRLPSGRDHERRRRRGQHSASSHKARSRQVSAASARGGAEGGGGGGGGPSFGRGLSQYDRELGDTYDFSGMRGVNYPGLLPAVDSALGAPPRKASQPSLLGGGGGGGSDEESELSGESTFYDAGGGMGRSLHSRDTFAEDTWGRSGYGVSGGYGGERGGGGHHPPPRPHHPAQSALHADSVAEVEDFNFREESTSPVRGPKTHREYLPDGDDDATVATRGTVGSLTSQLEGLEMGRAGRRSSGHGMPIIPKGSVARAKEAARLSQSHLDISGAMAATGGSGMGGEGAARRRHYGGAGGGSMPGGGTPMRSPRFGQLEEDGPRMPPRKGSSSALMVGHARPVHRTTSHEDMRRYFHDPAGKMERSYRSAVAPALSPLGPLPEGSSATDERRGSTRAGTPATLDSSRSADGGGGFAFGRRNSFPASGGQKLQALSEEQQSGRESREGESPAQQIGVAAVGGVSVLEEGVAVDVDAEKQP